MGNSGSGPSRHPFLKSLGELDGVDVVDAGRLRTDAQRLVVAAQAEDGLDAEGRRAVSVALQRDAVAVPRHHGQHGGAAFARQHRRARQGRAVNPARVIRHHHRVQVGWQDGGELLHRAGVAAAWRQALRRESQPAGSQRLTKSTVRCRHCRTPLPGGNCRPLWPRELCQRAGGQVPQGLDYPVADGRRLGVQSRGGKRFHGSSGRQRHVFRRRAGQVEEHQTLAAQADLVQEGAEEGRPARAPLAAFEIMAVVVLQATMQTASEPDSNAFRTCSG